MSTAKFSNPFAIFLPMAALILVCLKVAGHLPELAWWWCFLPLFVPFAFYATVWLIAVSVVLIAFIRVAWNFRGKK